MKIDTNQYLEFIKELTEKSGAIIRKQYRSPSLHVESKADTSPVTETDRAAEKLLRTEITRRYPEHGIVGEEYGEENPSAEFVWMLDPIDGTKSFVAGCPLFGTLICLLYQGRPIVGAIHQAISGDLCLGDGSATYLNGEQTRVRECKSLSAATLLSTDYLDIARYQSEEKFRALIDQVNIFRTWGDCYGYLLLAGGFADIMCDPIMNTWDLMALIPIIEGAGGVISSWDGKDAVSAKSCLAAGPDLHPQLVDLLSK